MKSSSSSSATATNLPPARPQRRGFALTGPSVTLDPSTHAVRADLADVRLAEYVFAPHYAAPVAATVTRATPLDAARTGAQAVATLDAGETFEVLDLVGVHAWGVSPGRGLVGWVDREALAWAKDMAA